MDFLTNGSDLIVKRMKVDILHNKDAFSCQKSKYIKIDEDLTPNREEVAGNIQMNFKYARTNEIALAKFRVLSFKASFLTKM